MTNGIVWIGVIGLWTVAGCATGASQAPSKERSMDPGHALGLFLRSYEARVAPLEKELGLATWQATTSGDPQAYQRVAELEVALRKAHSDAQQAEALRSMAAQGPIGDPLLARQLVLLRNLYEENQIETDLLERMVRLSTEVQKAFSDHRGSLDGKPVGDNELKEILRKETDSARREAAWGAYMTKGPVVRARVLELVALRNQAARSLGYANYYEMRLRLQEQDPDTIQAIFDDLARLTDAPFARLMEEVRAELAKRYGTAPDQIRPWHYEDPFFQEAPTLRGVDLDPFFSGKDPRALVQAFFSGVGLDPADILERSDLYEKPGKMPHAYCIHIDRAGDVRILANLQPNEQWTSTLMHEMGHAVYDRFVRAGLPWSLRSPAHPFTTEAIAMLFGRQTRNPAWLVRSAGVAEADLARVRSDLGFSLRLSMLVFARWAMVMMNFERQLYADPRQDLNKLWWDLKERYQLVQRPAGRDAPDWAAKIHIAVWPAYYHNYLLGELMASQLLDALARDVVPAEEPNQLDLTGKPEVGAWLKARLFEPGASLRWDELLIQATGETLNPKYFASQFVAGS
jgi:peptidyl-dipeptidase A